MILNETYDFARQAPPEVKDAFRGIPDKRLLRSGERYFRTITAGHNQVLGEWWFPKATFERTVIAAGRNGVPLQEAVRALLAVSIEFNPRIERLMEFSPRESIYGFVGRTRHQRLSAPTNNVLLMGGLDQIWVPGVESRHLIFGTSVAL